MKEELIRAEFGDVNPVGFCLLDSGYALIAEKFGEPVAEVMNYADGVTVSKAIVELVDFGPIAVGTPLYAPRKE